MDEFKSMLSPLKRKLNIEKWLGYFLNSAVVCLAVILPSVIASKFFYIKNFKYIMAGIICVFTVVPFLRVVLKPVSFMETAKAGDKLGLEDRLATAYEIFENGNDGNICMLAVSDAFEHGRKADLSKAYKMKFPKKPVKIIAALLAAVLAAGFVDNPYKEDIRPMVEPQVRQLEEIKKVLNSEKEIGKEELNKVNKEINSIIKELEQSVSKKEALSNLDKAQQQMKNLEKTGAVKDLKSISQSLEGNETGEALKNAIESGDAGQIDKGLETMNEKARNLTDEELENLLKELGNAAEGIDDQELKDALQSYAGELSSGNFNSSSNGLKNLSGEISKAVKQSESLQSAVDDINKTLAEASEAVQNGSGQNQSGSQQQSGKDGVGGQNGQNGPGGSNSGSGQGENNGSGRGSGHAEPEAELSRDAQNKAGYDTKVEGAENDGGQTEMTMHKAAGTEGGLVPYEEVISEYKEEAIKSIEDSTVPYGMKELVADYFSELENEGE